MLACFHSCRILPQLSDFLKIIKRIGEINLLHSLSILVRILSGPADMCGFRFVSNLFMPVFVMLMFCISRCGLCPLSRIGSSLAYTSPAEMSVRVPVSVVDNMLMNFTWMQLIIILSDHIVLVWPCSLLTLVAAS